MLDLAAALLRLQAGHASPTGVNTGCSTTTRQRGCSGTESSISLLADYKFAKRFDGYFGTFWTGVQDGLANGFLNKSTLTTTTGIRFRF